MKAPAFQFYPGDFLSSPDVQIMEAHEVGAYLLLLCAAWQSERPGYLPNDEGRLRRLARLSTEQWKESSALVLGKFPVQEGGEYRANKRMLFELDKQEAYRAKQAGNGARGGRPRKANDNPDESQTKGLGYSGETQTKAKKSSSSSSSSSSTTDVVPHATTTTEQPLTAKSKSELVAGQVAADGTATFTAETWVGLNDADQFATICRSLTALKLPANLDTEVYRESIKRKVADRGMNVPAPTMRNFIESFFMKLPTGELRIIDAAMPLLPTPKHELPEYRQERPGQVIAIAGVAHDDSMNRMKLATYQGYWPTAKIHVILPR